MTKNYGFYVIGYQPKVGVPTEDYQDFPVGTKFTYPEVVYGIDQGTFPPGLILQTKGGPPAVVVGQYGDQQFMPAIDGMKIRKSEAL